MKHAAPPPASAEDEISRLTALLQKTGQRLEALTGGQVDSVVDRTGRVFLLKGVQAQLRHAEDSRQAAILNALTTHIALLDARGVIISVNEAWRQFADANALQGPGHAVGRNYLEICEGARGDDSLEARQAAEGIRSVLERRRKRFSMEYPCHSPAQQRWFQMTVTPLADDRKHGVVVMHLDITERRRGEEDLRRFAGAMDAISDAIYLVDRGSMQFVHVNDTACRMMNKTQAELMALNPWEILSIPRAELERAYDTLIASGVEATPLEMIRPRAGGAQAWVELRRHALRSGDHWAIVTLVRDVSERKRLEVEQRATLQLLDNIVENIPTAVQLKSVQDDFRVLKWNKAAELMYGLPREAAIGRNVHDLWPEADADRMHAADLDLLVTGKTQDFPDRLVKTRDRGDIRAHMRKVALFDAGGKATHLLVVADDMTTQLADQARLRESESRFRSLTKLSSDWFWEQDDQHRFVRFSGGEGVEGWGPDQSKAVGLHRWDLGGVIPISSGWEEHKALLDAHKPFRKFEYQRILDDGRLQYVEASGEPIFDAGGGFAGYRGVATEITQRKLDEQDLKRFRAAMDSAGDAIVLVDRASMRYVDVNQSLCDLVGYTRQELIGMTPMELFGAKRDTLERDYDAIIANESGVADFVEGWYRHKNGTLVPIETRRRAMRTDAGWIIVGSARDITDRRISNDKIRQVSRMYAMLSGINALIVRAHSRDDLFRGACQIAVEKGGFHSAWIGVVDIGAQRIVPAALAGADEGLFASVRSLFSSSAGGLPGNTLAAQAIRQKRAFVSNDSQNDPAVALNKTHAEFNVRSMAMVPLVIEDQANAVLALYASELDFFHTEEITLLTELAGDIAFAMEHLEKTGKLARTTRVNAMLSGINGAIVRIRDRQELFEETCRIAIETGGMSFAWIGVADASGTHLQLVASAGRDEGFLQTIRDRLALSDAAPEAQGLGTRALREGRVVVVNDVAADPVINRRKAFADRGIKAVAIFPLFIAGQTVGTFALHSEQAGFFDDDELRLLNEVAANIAFALEHIEKEEKVRRLTRVYAVLSGINTLIVRVRDRDELFKEACQVAVTQGRFTMAWLGIVDRGAMELVPVASAGATQDHSVLINQRFSIGVDAPPGNTVSARAIREKKAAISNDVQNDPEVLFKEEHALRGSRSMAMLPLQIAGEVVGLLALYSDEIGFFDDEEITLLNELAGDIAFAIDNLGKQARIDYLAYYDVLTGLANRRLFLERVAQFMRGASAGGYKMAVFLIDLERFRNVNDSLGRLAGDDLLKQVAEWLKHYAGDASLLARVGSDHFALVLPEIRPDGSVTRLLEKTIAIFLEHPFQLGGAVLRIAVKVGAALYPDDGADADTLLRNAEVALKKAKQRGDRYLFYKQKMNATAAGNLTLENQLRQALENSEFVLHYQPKVNLASGKLTSCEALIRWNDPRTGLVPPGRFIPILEETGLIYDVGRWALRQAVADYLRWRAAGLPAVRIAVNVSPLQLRNRGFVGEIKQVIGIDAAAVAGLELEITESLIMEDIKNSIASLKAIRDMGVTIAIDDFGTGFSSLSYLAKLPVDTLKIDRSFIIDMTAGPEGLALVSTIINLAHSLQLKVVAEGVETEEQSRLLRLLRCDEFQGFLFSKPVPAETFEAKFLSLPDPDAAI